MNIIAVDDERHALIELKEAIEGVTVGAAVTCFSSANEALGYAKENRVDVAFLDIDMDEMNGLFLAKRLKRVCAKTNIIFVTGYSHYALDAFDLSASGYVMKPINPGRVEKELDNLRNPISLPDRGIHIQCFGSFEVFANGLPVTFARAKAKEALAYLVDRRGASVTKKELAAILLEDAIYNRSTQSYMHILISEMNHALKSVGATEFIINRRGTYAVDVSKFSCDYYDYENGIPTALNQYYGEYMSNYSWAEHKTGALSGKLYNL